ncbi:MAG: discoidin domain-containing protein [Bacteroides sp.]|nr:discoidin domain-containing protein [Bacteroides sp.]
MRYTIRVFVVLLFSFLFLSFDGLGQITLDDFENAEGWEVIQSDGVKLDVSKDEGMTGKAIRFDYDFTKGTGYGGIQKWFPIDLPENFEISFYVKAESPSNNFEIKFIDQSGDNVWWVNNRNYDFPKEWTRIRIRPRHIGFAWGPTDDRSFKRIDRIEFTIASFVGGEGTIWIDNLTLKPLDPEPEFYPEPLVKAASSARKQTPSLMLDGLQETWWFSKRGRNQYVDLDFQVRREIGGLEIDWLEDYAARAFEVLLSYDAIHWEKVYSVSANQGNTSFVRLPEVEGRYIKIRLLGNNHEGGFGIRELRLLDIEQSATMNDFLKYVAGHSPEGDYPRYFRDEASYWTVMGVNNDRKEALINEDGMVEVEKALFSIEPMIKMGDQIYNWSKVDAQQSLDFFDDFPGFQFSPSVTWNMGDVEFVTGISASGEANKNSQLNIGYAFKNLSSEIKELELFLLVRPFQVNPYYQFLNLPGGTGRIESIREMNPGRVINVDEKIIYSLRDYDYFSAIGFDEGSLVDFLRQGVIPEQKAVSDPEGLASGVLKYLIRLQPGEQTEFFLVVPFYEQQPDPIMLSNEIIRKEFQETNQFWEDKIDLIRFNLPQSADKIIDTYRSNLVYILINRDAAGIQPGSRSYERSWIRDGSLTSSALLKAGIVDEVRDFILWYAAYQYESGKVPCVVDFRGPDPVPEHDSHGQLIYLIREYFNFSRDTAFLRRLNPNVLSAVDYIESLVSERSTDHFKYGNDSIRAYYGIVPESISHEGYSEKPMHSYWDNFFIMKGLKDAVEIQRILGNQEALASTTVVRDNFTQNLYNSLRLAMKTRGIDYIPGCVELGDFDPTSTTVALTPCNELINLPKPEIYNTFERYYEFFKSRRDGIREWVNYTPYENRLIGSFILLDQPDRAHELIDFFIGDQRPHGWHHWAEVVWKDYRIPRFIGDMPHTWVGSDFLNAVRSMFVYENDYDESLVLAPALYQDWIDAPEGMSVENLPTYYGKLSYAIQKAEGHYVFSIFGDLELPFNGLEIRNFNQSKKPVRVTINGEESLNYNEKKIQVSEFPAEVVIYY